MCVSVMHTSHPHSQMLVIYGKELQKSGEASYVTQERIPPRWDICHAKSESEI
jgi:hypothetical protein